MNITKLSFILAILGLFVVLSSSQEAKELFTIQNTLYGGELINEDEDLLVVVSTDKVSTAEIDDDSQSDPEVVFTTNEKIVDVQFMNTESPWVFLLLADENNITQTLMALNYEDKQNKEVLKRQIEGEFGFESGYFVGNAQIFKLKEEGEIETIKTYAPGDELILTQTDKYLMVITARPSGQDTYQFISVDVIDVENNSTEKTEVVDCEGEIGIDFDIIGLGDFFYYKCQQDLFKVPIKSDGEKETVRNDINQNRFQLLNDEGELYVTTATTNDKSVIIDESGNIEEVNSSDIFQVHNRFFTIVDDELYYFNLKERKVGDKLDFQPFGAIPVKESDVLIDYNENEKIVEAVNVNNGQRSTLLTNVPNSVVTFAQEVDGDLYFGVQELTSDNYLENDTTFYKANFNDIKTSVGSSSSGIRLVLSLFVLAIVLFF